MAPASGIVMAELTAKLPSSVHSLELGLTAGSKKVAIVGGTNGLGRAIARRCAALGAHVTVVGRTFQDAGVDRLSFIKADLSTMAEAKRVGKELSADLDVLILTLGIVPAMKREVTPDGLERDMAVSYLSRLALLQELAPRMAAAASQANRRPRVFVMGFPGVGMQGDLDDPMGEKKYSILAVHSGTVEGNEALVLAGPARHPQLGWYGLNPGMVKTGIRSNLLGSGWLSWAMEGLVGLFTPTPEQYAARIVPILFAAELEGVSAVHFNQKGQAIKPSKALTPERVQAVLAVGEACIKRVTPLSDLD